MSRPKHPLERFLDKFQPMAREAKDQVRREIVERCEVVADCSIYPVVNGSGYGTKWFAESRVTHLAL